MVAKISTGKDLYGALAYNQTKVEEGHAKILDANLLPYPEDGRFRMGEHYRTEKPVIHISLNPHPDDVLTDGQLAAIGREYMEKLGYGNQPFLIFKHEDIDRHHIHIVSSTATTSTSCPCAWTAGAGRFPTASSTAGARK